MGIIKGRNMMLFLSPNGTSSTNYKSIAQATNHTLTISADTVDISTKDIYSGKWQTSELNTLNWSASSENLVCDDPQGVSYEDLVDYMIKGTKLTGVFGMRSGTTSEDANVTTGGWTPLATDGLKGEMIITNLVKNAPNGDNASFTVDFTGVGPLTKAGVAVSGGSTTVLSNKTETKVAVSTKED